MKKNEKEIKTIRELRKEFGRIGQSIKNKSISPKEAQQMNNAFGKMMRTVGYQLKYADQRKEKAQIDFMKCH